MNILQAFGIAVAIVLSVAAYVAVTAKVSDWVHRRFGSLDLSVLVALVMITVPVITGLLYAASNLGVPQ